MSGPVLHHRALGVHPGAFVQSTAPATTDVQDGVLWVDISGPAPYPLKVWDATAGQWRPVGITVSGAPVGALLPPGTTGELLVNIAGEWVVLAPGTLGQNLVMQPYGSALVPQWTDGCCDQVIRGVPSNPGTANPCGPSTDAVLCGAAVSIADYLEQYYANMRQVLNWAATTTLLVSFTRIAALLAGAAPPIAGFGGALTVKKALQLFGALLARGLNITVAPVLTSTQKKHILRAVRCALPPCPADLTITDAVRDAWCSAIAADSIFTDLQPEIFWLLSHAVLLAAWQVRADMGAMQQSTACDTLPCGDGRAFQGGAQFGLHAARSFQGGAQFGLTSARSRQGGAQFGLNTARSRQGGAEIV